MDIWVILVAAGIPSAVVGIGVWRLKLYFKKREAKRDEVEQRRKKHEVLMMQSDYATTRLSIETAIAVRDKRCNGTMEKALACAERVKQAQGDFLVEMGVSTLFDE